MFVWKHVALLLWARSLWGFSPCRFSRGHTSDRADLLLTLLPQLQSHLIPGLNLAAVGLFPASSSAVPPPPSSVTGAAPYSSFMVGARSYDRGHLAPCMASLKESDSLWDPDGQEVAGRGKGGLRMLPHCSWNLDPMKGHLGCCQGCWQRSSFLPPLPGHSGS